MAAEKHPHKVLGGIFVPPLTDPKRTENAINVWRPGGCHVSSTGLDAMWTAARMPNGVCYRSRLASYSIQGNIRYPTGLRRSPKWWPNFKENTSMICLVAKNLCKHVPCRSIVPTSSLSERSAGADGSRAFGSPSQDLLTERPYSRLENVHTLFRSLG
jgi:hypothetical protein